MSKYRKIHTSMWGDRKFRELSDDGKLLWVWLLTGSASTSMPGIVLTGRAAAAEAMGWTSKAFDEAFGEVFAKGMLKASFEDRFVWLPKATKYATPESPNVVRSWRNIWDDVPECELKTEAFQSLKAFTEALGEGFAKAFREACAQPSPNQKQEQKQEQEQKKPLSVPPTDVGDQKSETRIRKPTPAEEVYSHWLDCRQRHNPKAQRIKIGDKDRKALQALLASGRSVEEMKLACRGHFLSPHHLGQNDRHTPYLAFSLTIRPTNIDAFIAFAEQADAVEETQPKADEPKGPVVPMPKQMQDWLARTDAKADDIPNPSANVFFQTQSCR